MSKSLALVCGLLLVATVLHPAGAVICESFTTQEKCEQIMTSSGGCKWVAEEGKCVHDPTKILPAGMVGIASVGDAVPVFVGSPPQPEVSCRGGAGLFCSISYPHTFPTPLS